MGSFSYWDLIESYFLVPKKLEKGLYKSAHLFAFLDDRLLATFKILSHLDLLIQINVTLDVQY
jgi:hypothetical protein